MTFSAFDPLHFVYFGVTLLLIVVGLIMIFKFKPSFKVMFTIATIVSIVSEFVKTFSSLEFFKLAGTEELVPYISMAHFPLHLCAIQVFLIIAVWLMKPENKLREALLGFMFPTMIVGGFLGILLPGELNVLSPRCYQYFMFHGFLVVLGIYIMKSKEVKLKPINYLTSIGLLTLFGLISLYVNSLFAQFSFTEVNGETVKTLESITNLFFTMRSPVGFLPDFTKEIHWWIYILCVYLLVFCVFALFYIPTFIKAKKNKRN